MRVTNLDPMDMSEAGDYPGGTRPVASAVIVCMAAPSMFVVLLHRFYAVNGNHAGQTV